MKPTDVEHEYPFLWFRHLQYAKPDYALRGIAKAIREGCNDPTFLKILAAHIDPDHKTTPWGTKFELRHRERKAPKQRPNSDLASFLELHIETFQDSKVTAVKAEAAKRFSVSATKCSEVLAQVRKRRSKSDLTKLMDEVAHYLREEGHPDYQPLWPDK